MNYQSIIEDIYSSVAGQENFGQKASYIPELSKVDASKFGVHITTVNNESYAVGDSNEPFSIQSIAKALSLVMAYKLHGSEIWKRVGVEPSGTPFNSLVQLEADKGIPRNPFINAGALVICDILLTELKNPKEAFIQFVRSLANSSTIDYSDTIAQSEKEIGYRNVALCNFIKSFDNIKNKVEDVLDFYFYMCSIKMSCADLSKTFLFLANHGKNIYTDKALLNESQTKRMNAIMLTCGFYNESGDFAYKVGLPGKSGVGGGIVAVHPNKYSIATWSPNLNEKGNSFRGMNFLEEFTTRTASSIF